MKKILIVVDMQNDFINGSLGTKEAENIVDNVVNKIKEYKGENSYIYITQDTHYDNYLDLNEGKHLPVKHCIKNTDGWKINEKIINELSESSCRYYEKNNFGSYILANDLFKKYSHKQEEVQIELIGLCTDICIISNALLIKAYLPETKIIVDSSCCAGVTPESHEQALNTMKMCQIDII